MVDQPDASRVQLLLPQAVVVAVLLVQLFMGELLWEQVLQQMRGKVGKGQADLIDAGQQLLAHKAVWVWHLKVKLWKLQLVKDNGHQPDLLGVLPRPLTFLLHCCKVEIVLHLDN